VERALREVNANIRIANKEAITRNKATSLKGGAVCRSIKHLVTPKQFYKYDEYILSELNSVYTLPSFIYKLKAEVFLYYYAVREANPDVQVIKNVRLHGKGKKYAAAEAERLGIT